MKRIDGWMSRVAQNVWPGAVVWCETGTDDRGDWEDWHMEQIGPNVGGLGTGQAWGLGSNFGEAKQALLALIAAEKARRGNG